jgi:hypothetical protein
LRLPLGYLSSILEPRLEHIDRASPEMGVNKTAKRQLGTAPYLMGSESSALIGDLVVQINSMAEGKGPEVTMVVFWPAKSGIDHHRPTGADGILCGIFGHTIVVMPTNAAMTDALTL